MTAVSMTPTQIDPGTASSLKVENTGTREVYLSPVGGRVLPGRTVAFAGVRGRAVSAYTSGGSSAITVTVLGTFPAPTGPLQPGGDPNGTPNGSLTKADLSPALAAELDGKLAASAATGTYARHATARPGNRMVWLGDSLTQWQDAVAAQNAPTSALSHSQRVSLANLGSILSNQRALYVGQAGVGGETSAQILARFDTDVTPFAPTVVHILAGTNDPSGTLATFTLPNITAMIAKTRAIGAVPLLGLLPPNNTTSKSEAFNAAYRRLADTLGVTVIDYCTPLIDPTNGSIQSALNRDNTHPTDAGFVLMAQAFATAFADVAPPWAPPLPDRNTSTNNLVANGLFLLPGGGARPSSWIGGTGTGITTTTEAATFGNWVKIDAVASAGAAQLYQNIATAPVADHRYALLGKVKTAWTSGANGFQIRNRITLADASTVDMMPMNNMAVTLTDGTFYCEYVAPATATSQQISLFCGAGTMTLWVARMGLYDLTALDIV